MKPLVTLLLLLSTTLTAWSQGLLVVGREWQREGLRPLVEWKREQGYDVRELYPEPHPKDSVRAILRRYHDTAAHFPEYLLLVGSTADFPPYFSTHNPMGIEATFTDVPYCDFDGDLRPDALMGRLPACDSVELAAMVRKTLRYEQGLMDTTHLGRALLMAGYECVDPAPELTNGQVRRLAEGFSEMGLDTVCFYNPAFDSLPPEWEEMRRDSVLIHLRRGAGHVNYTGHGKYNRWVNPTISATDVAALPDNDRFCFLVSNCCRSCNYGGVSLGEAFLRHPGNGAACVIGATNETLWQEDYAWATAVYEAYFAGQARTAGEMLRAGCQAVEESGSQFADYYWQIYVLLGDPTLEPRLGTPVDEPLNIPYSLFPTPYSLRVYPNPASDHITVNAPYRLYDMQGREVGRDISQLPNGIYIVKTAFAAKRLIIQH